MVEVLDDALGAGVSVGWSYGEALWNDNFPTGNLVNLSLITGPSFHNQNGVHGTLLIPPTVVTVTVDTATVAVRYILTVNNYRYFHDALGGEDVDDIRDALVALVVADTESPFTAAGTIPAGELTVTPDTPGSIWQMSVSPLMSAVPTLDTQAVLKTQDTRVFVVDFGCFSKGRSPRTGAWDIVARCQAALTSPEHAEIFDRYDVGVWGKGPATDLSDIAGGHWESRVSFDVTLAMKSTFTVPVEQIEVVNVVLDLSNPSHTETFSVSSP